MASYEFQRANALTMAAVKQAIAITSDQRRVKLSIIPRVPFRRKNRCASARQRAEMANQKARCQTIGHRLAALMKSA